MEVGTRIFLMLYICIDSFSVPTEMRSAAKNVTGIENVYNIQEGQPPVQHFPCQTFTKPDREVTVHTLTPMDVGVVGAIGDSITAGFGVNARTVFGFRENRGMSFSIGGDASIKQLMTIPNILRLYNPDLKGYSLGKAFAMDGNSHLNVAQVGAVSMFVPMQAIDLVNRMKFGKEGIDYENDWKVITMLIGGNDICNFCISDMFSAENYVSNVKKALDILHREVPKAYVNAIEMIDLLQYQELDYIKRCSSFHRIFCPCMATAVNPERRAAVNNITRQYQQGLRDLVASGRYDTRDDFTVVVQPFLEEAVFRAPDHRPIIPYFAPDCFHLSKLGQELAAGSLWINMNQPVGRKEHAFSEDIICPSPERPYFYTRLNSGQLAARNILPKVTAEDKRREQEHYENQPQHNEISVSQENLLKTGKSKDYKNQAKSNVHGNSRGTRPYTAAIMVGVMVVVALVSTSIWYMKKQKKNLESISLLDDKSPQIHIY